jgi:flagellar hook-length control protein FliK
MTVIPAVVPADPAPASTEASSPPPAKPGFDHALARASHKASTKPNAKATTRPDDKARSKDGETANARAKTQSADDTDAAPAEVTALGDATVAALVAALTGDVAPTSPSTDTPASNNVDNVTDTAANQQGITNVFAAAVAALTAADANAKPDATRPASENAAPAAISHAGSQEKGAERSDFVQTVPGATTDKGRAIDIPPIPPTGEDANANGTAHSFTRTTVPAATNATATAVEHAADPSPVHGTAPAALTRNNETQASTGAPPSIATAPVNTTTRVDAVAPTTETAPAAPAELPTPAEQLVAVMRPLQRTADGSYRVRIELRPPELGRVDMRIEVKDGVVHASIHAEHAETAELVRNALDDLRARLDSDGVRAGTLEVNDGRANDARREQRGQRESLDETELVTAPALMTTRPQYQSDALLDVRL